MFSVYGMTGRLFNGTLEELREVAPVHATTRAREIEPVGRDPILPADNAELHRSLGDEPHRNALSAYAQTQHALPQRHPLTRVDELMSRSVITVPYNATVLAAWHLLSKHHVGQAPVVDQQGALVGLLLRADLLRPELLPALTADVRAWQGLLTQRVEQMMWTPVPSVAADTDIRRVARVLLDSGLPGLPVADDRGAVIGFVSRSDILRAVVTDPPLDLWG